MVGKHVDAYKVLEKLHEEGVIRAIGIANYTIEVICDTEVSCVIKSYCCWVKSTTTLSSPASCSLPSPTTMILENQDYEELKKVMKIKPVVNQLEISPWCFRYELLRGAADDSSLLWSGSSWRVFIVLVLVYRYLVSN